MTIEYEKLKKIVEKMTKNHHTISTMESCTGGSLSSAITNIPGASEVFQYGVVTYTSEYKIKMGVDPRIIEKFGVYSLETSKAMAKSACLLTGSDIGIGVSGNLNLDDIEGKNGVVYFSIYQFVEKKFYSKVITINKPKREESKKSIINVIIDALYNIYF